MKPTLLRSVLFFVSLGEYIMLVGKCTKCGKRYIGWALSRQEHQMCPDCGARLIVRNMSEKYQSNTETVVTLKRDGIAEWQETLEDTLPHFML